MDPVLIVSPHLDDAVLSCGQFMAGRPDTVVVSMFTGTPSHAERVITTYDRNCGFANARDAMRIRRGEDDKALHLLGAFPVHLPFVDHQYAPDQRPTPDELADAIAAHVELIEPDMVLAPAGLGHPDHQLVAAACRLLDTDAPVHVYEELPYRVLFPEEVPAALAQWGIHGGAPVFIGTGDLAAKNRAVACYASQLWALNRHAVRCPERFWTPACD